MPRASVGWIRSALAPPVPANARVTVARQISMCAYFMSVPPLWIAETDVSNSLLPQRLSHGNIRCQPSFRLLPGKIRLFGVPLGSATPHGLVQGSMDQRV